MQAHLLDADRPTLVLLAGAPGVGKSTVARILLDRLDGCAWLDGDDLWRMDPVRVDETTTAMVEDNAAHVLGNFLRSGSRHVLFSWVMHRQDIIDRIIAGIGIDARIRTIILSTDESTLLARLGSHSEPERQERALLRLKQSESIAGLRIDTTEMTPAAVAEGIMAALVSESAPEETR